MLDEKRAWGDPETVGLLVSESDADALQTETNGRKRKLSWRVWLVLFGVVALNIVTYARQYSKPCAFHSSVKPEEWKINWTPCGNGVECGKLLVPLSYSNPSLGKATLAVTRYPAPKHAKRLGSLFLNPGGPGGSGTQFIHRIGARVSEIVDGRYDIVSWDPRGVNLTEPRVQCFNTTFDEVLFTSTTIMGKEGFEIGNLSSPEGLAIFDQQFQSAMVANEVASARCQVLAPGALEYVGTNTVAHDLERLSSVIEGKDVPVNYWGFSYGTILGSYFVNIFPHRVGRVVIDGVVNPLLWNSQEFSQWNKYFLVDIEKELQNFIKGCIDAGPKRCALAAKASSVKSLNAAIDGFIHNLYERPLPVPHAKRPGVLTSGFVRNLIFQAMYSPGNWTQLATALAPAIFEGNGTAVLNAQPGIELDELKEPASTSFASQAVLCADGPLPPAGSKPEDEEQRLRDSIVYTQSHVTPHFPANIVFSCARWKPRASDRFPGPFNHTLSNTMLIIGNTADPVTPLSNAKVVNDLLKNSSRLIIQDGNGHCSLAQVSLCTALSVKSYFLRGTLPENGRVCPVDQPLFPEENASVSSWLSAGDGNVRATSADIALLENMQALGRAVQPLIS